MRHLFNTRVAVEELAGDFADGTPQYTWAKAATVVDPFIGEPGELMCRLDLTFQRPGKDAPQPIVAGRAPDRIGIMFCAAVDGIKAGQRVRALSGPLTGATFELRAIPDPAQDYGPVAHHLEVQEVEVSQKLTGVFPGSDLETGL